MEIANEKPKSGSLFSRDEKIVAEKSVSAAAGVTADTPEASASATTSAAPPFRTYQPTDPSPLDPCPTCHSAIRWLNAAATPHCIGCHPPKVKALVRSREILIVDHRTGERRWETLVELPGGQLASETGVFELLAAGAIDHATAASVGVHGGGGSGGCDGGEQTLLVDVESGLGWPDEFFASRSPR